MPNAPQTVTFAHNFGGRASATHLHSVQVFTETGKPLHTIVEPSEFRIRENGTVTIYSRKYPQTSVYGLNTHRRIFTGVPREDGTKVHSLTF